MGYTFSGAFLPTANLPALAAVLRFSAAGTAGLEALGGDLAWWTRRLVEYAASLV